MERFVPITLHCTDRQNNTLNVHHLGLVLGNPIPNPLRGMGQTLPKPKYHSNLNSIFSLTVTLILTLNLTLILNLSLILNLTLINDNPDPSWR